jgi:hypothetical protein
MWAPSFVTANSTSELRTTQDGWDAIVLHLAFMVYLLAMGSAAIRDAHRQHTPPARTGKGPRRRSRKNPP